jgi:hypothetical protein
MPRMIFRISYFLTIITLLTQIVLASEASPKVASHAPFPTQVLTAKKVFIANAPGDNLPNSLGGPDRVYNDFYVATKNWGHYEVVSSLADADLVFAISLTNSLSEVSGTRSGCSSSTARDLRLAILDAKTGVPLWWLAQTFEQKLSFGHRPENPDAAFTRSMDMLLDNFKKLIDQQVMAHP